MQRRIRISSGVKIGSSRLHWFIDRCFIFEWEFHGSHLGKDFTQRFQSALTPFDLTVESFHLISDFWNPMRLPSHAECVGQHAERFNLTQIMFDIRVVFIDQRDDLSLCLEFLFHIFYG